MKFRVNEAILGLVLVANSQNYEEAGRRRGRGNEGGMEKGRKGERDRGRRKKKEIKSQKDKNYI